MTLSPASRAIGFETGLPATLSAQVALLSVVCGVTVMLFTALATLSA
jgi:hypothetical protein